MALPLDKLGTTFEPYRATIDPERALAYAAATNDANPAFTSGKYAPPVFGVVPVWDAMLACVGSIVPPEALMMIVHGEQDMHFHQPLIPGLELVTRVTPFSVRIASSGTRFTVRVDSADPQDHPVMTQYVTMFIRGMSDGEERGPDKPDHTFPEEARERPVGTGTTHVDEDQTYRYRDASGDQMPIHVDADFAKSVGLPGIIAHGLCTMAMTSQAVLNHTGGDPGRLRRLAVRFSKNVFPGNDVVTSLYEAGPGALVFEAHSAGALVIANGRAEVVPEG